MPNSPKYDTEIDRIVDDLVKDEDTAAVLKDKLHKSFSEPAATVYARTEVSAEDDDDIWDNLPV
ncbi:MULTISPECIES: hypothetical protein [Roseobacteraceae]|jgi:hypothetical protein|uniref:Uncharacterized protein n=1 Tax=Celeribacter baekdonensis B30 TaxID=1208323 RepID=K2J127_9RHOB|nr:MULTISPECIES: hypothetical protein [Roseobacteraceae]EKE68783.1 hypothetical protein B30_17230 [Celeribacter baekdonensis B30]KAB6718202.1 hypothetical protein C8029_00500 [Roseobacter sp. TSBP12]|tara:strand:- start:26597 stop:26788 length:192 start_codon:yes stop_codon:yes gene_type:complete